ncbi:hypothetical protein GCM10011316_04890 [Roseibium aquae]|uniref:Cytochrome c domain-containing protein n=1 Tax=Roseibium aquae TaxID=1323746 RepID=A0A916T8F8_9HYPH|nr:cytochrome c [Roseibium aquae]GGB35780.1 hypothetical protein GCM10011316_04890 [Roseibium aquae]
MMDLSFKKAAGGAGLLALGVAAVLAFDAERVFDLMSPDPVGLFRPDDPDVVRRGEALYLAHCASCHGRQLEGAPDWQTPQANGLMPAPPHDETGHTWHHSDQLLFDMTKYGIGPAIGDPRYRSEMPAYESVLSDVEIIAILSFIKAQWPQEIRASQDRLSELAGSHPVR